MRNLIIAIILCFVAVAADAQSTPTATSTFSFDAQALSLPGGKQTVAATVAGGNFYVTPNFSFRNDDIVSPANNFSGYFGGFQYNLPVLSRRLNNMSPNLSGSQFQFYVTASAGVDRISYANASTAQHYAFLAGGGINYSPANNKVFSVNLVEVRYAKLPGLNNNTAIVSSGVQFHF